MASWLHGVCKVRFSLALLVLVALVAGCGSTGPGAGASGGSGGSTGASSSGAAAPKPATAPQPAAQAPAPAPALKPLGTLKIALINCSDLCGWQLAANEKGYLKAAGVDAQYTFIGGSSPMMKALIAGEIDVAEIAAPEVFLAREQGAKVKLVGASVPGTAFSILAKSSVKDLKSLEGKVVGTSAPGASPYQMVLGLMEKAGGDAGKIQWVNAGDNAGRLKALLGGQVDAVPVPSSFEAQISGKTEFHVLARVGEQLPEYIRVAVAVRDDVIEKKAELLTAYFKAYSKGFREMAKNKDAFVQVSMDVTKLGNPNPKTFGEAWDTSVQQKLVSPDFSVDPKAITFVQDMNIKVGSQKQRLSLNELYDDRFVKAVQAELGAWKW